MYKSLIVLGLFGLFGGTAGAAEREVESCEQLRLKIQAKTGVVSTVDVDLLGQLPQRPECRFSADEAYRAAYGDRPLPPPERDAPEHRHHRDDD